MKRTVKRTVIFDLDGTLADTSGDLLAAANGALAAMGRAVRLDPEGAEDRAVALRGGRAMLTLALMRSEGKADPALLDAGYPALLEAYAGAIAEHTVFYPGAMEAVHALRTAGHRVGICTNKPEGLAIQLMTALGALDAFDSLVGADTLEVRKPHPAPFHEAVRRAGGDPAYACLIGDTNTDRETARAADVPCVLVTFGPAGGDMAALEPAALLADFAKLPELICDL